MASITTLCLSLTLLGADPAMGRSLPAGHSPLVRRQRLRAVQDLLTAELLAELEHPSWSLRPIREDDPPAPICPWHHPAITELVARASDPSHRDDKTRITTSLREGLVDATNRWRRFNAAVALAHLGSDSGVAVLSETLLDPEVPLSVRVGSAFALAQHPGRLDEARLRRLMSTWFDVVQERQIAPSDPEQIFDEDQTKAIRHFREKPVLVGAVFHAIVQVASRRSSFDASRDEVVIAAVGMLPTGIVAVENDPKLLRQVAAIAHANRPWPTMPETLRRLLRDPDAIVRRTALAACATHPTSAAHDVVLDASYDADASVRRDALETLARFPGLKSADRLREASASSSPSDRLASIPSAATLGLDRLLLKATGDESNLVRAKAAAFLSDCQAPGMEEVLRRLLADRSSAVQEAAIRSIVRRPKSEAIPLLIEGLDSPASRTRATAAKALAYLWPEAPAFDAVASPAERTQMLATIENEWRSGRRRHLARHRGKLSLESRRQLKESVAALLGRWYGPERRPRGELSEELLALGPQAVPFIEEVLEEHDSYPGPQLLTKVLGPLDPTYALLNDLWSSNPRTETARIAAIEEELAHLSLTPMQAAEVVRYTRRRDSDGAWLRLLELVERDAPETSRSIDELGLRHQNPHIRRRTLERMLERSGPQNAQMLVPLLNDSHSLTRMLALRAAGRTGDDSIAPLLRESMQSRDDRTSLEAAHSLSQLGDREGLFGLLRLCQARDESVQRDAVRYLGDVKVGGEDQERFVIGLLLRSLDDPKLEMRRAALAALEKRTGRSVKYDDRGQLLSEGKQAELWRKSLAGMFDESPTPEFSMPRLPLP
ncbi:HEAT repeat protein [Planctomycetes bacterium Pan216]|uniref:HEAT repeat protein n=1 Tax=Kolteria novifilia TaxID=2527975 RepID=A0A518BAN6_9BACT|nr:HEAT repeat protein [Planctomycetes bacterium Pan216]